MSFTIRKANINDATIVYEMIELYNNEMNIRNKPFENSQKKFIEDCFGSDSIVTFFIAEFKGNVLGYCGFVHSYSIIVGPSVNILEVFVKKEYRNLGVSVFLFSKVIDIAFENNSYLIKWLISLKDSKLIIIEEKAGVDIDRDTLILNIYKKDMKGYLQNLNGNNPHGVRLVKSFELPDVFNCVNNLATETNRDLKLDVYKLMSAVFSSNPKIKILVVLFDNVVSGFISFYESYCTSSGKSLIVENIYVNKKYRSKGVGISLLNELFYYAYKNNFTKVESTISKYEVEKIEGLKELGIFPYGNLREAYYVKEEFKRLYNIN